VPQRRLLILTRRRENASFRQRIAPYLLSLEQRGIGCQVVELSPAWLRRSRQFFKGRRFDGVWLHRKTLTAWDSLCLPRRGRLIYDFDDAIMYQARAGQAGPHPGRLRRFRRTMRRCDLVLAGNALLADHARQAGAARVTVVPTGLDLRRYPPKTDHAAPGPVRMVWIGSKSTLKQVVQLRPALEAVAAAHPGITLRIIADAALEVPGLHVESLAWTRDGESAMLAECDIGIAPMPDTPFTRGKCGFKVLQYMAAGLPVVTSPVGVNAEYVTPDQTGLWAETTEDWVAAIARLAADPAARQQLGQAGRRRAENEFDFSVLREKVCEGISKALD
jgi:glycosyltransferase involved in cell wall biosynthesis